MNNQDWKTDIRKERHSITQEDFTPSEIVDILLQEQEDLFTDFSKTFCDPCIGIGFIYLEILKRRLEHCKTTDDILNAVSTMYGTELMEDNVDECKKNILFEILKFTSSHNLDINDGEIMKILNHNIICTDIFKWDYENWKPILEYKETELF
jgi:type I restriction-modification system DNA methylase subunit